MIGKCFFQWSIAIRRLICSVFEWSSPKWHTGSSSINRCSLHSHIRRLHWNDQYALHMSMSIRFDAWLVEVENHIKVSHAADSMMSFWRLNNLCSQPSVPIDTRWSQTTFICWLCRVVYDCSEQHKQRSEIKMPQNWLTNFHVPLFATPLLMVAWISRQSLNDGPQRFFTVLRSLNDDKLFTFNWTIFEISLFFSPKFVENFRNSFARAHNWSSEEVVTRRLYPNDCHDHFVWWECISSAPRHIRQIFHFIVAHLRSSPHDARCTG